MNILLHAVLRKIYNDLGIIDLEPYHFTFPKPRRGISKKRFI